MFEATLYTKLIGDGELANILATYEGAPSIFNLYAPEQATAPPYPIPNAPSLPYMTFDIDENSAPMDVIDRFLINIDYFDFGTGTSRANARLAMKRVEFILDPIVIRTDPDYDSIRIWKESVGEIRETDRREIHYNIRLTARAGRKAWMAQL